jgi:hypothetical protein
LPLTLSSSLGIENIVDQIKFLVFYPIRYHHHHHQQQQQHLIIITIIIINRYPELYTHLGVRPPCGLLLNGPSGCGK